MDLHIKDVLKNYIKKDRKIGDAYYTQKIKSFWEAELSQSIVTRTEDIKYMKGKLCIKVNSSALRHELFNNRQSLMDKINVHLDADIVHIVELS